jgi:hypothetical protein
MNAVLSAVIDRLTRRRNHDRIRDLLKLLISGLLRLGSEISTSFLLASVADAWRWDCCLDEFYEIIPF